MSDSQPQQFLGWVNDGDGACAAQIQILTKVPSILHPRATVIHLTHWMVQDTQQSIVSIFKLNETLEFDVKWCIFYGGWGL